MFNVLGVLFLWLTFEKIYASMASPLTATYPAIMILFAYIFLKEKLRKTELLGVIFVVIGIIGVSII